MKFKVIEHSNGNISVASEGMTVKHGKNDHPTIMARLESDQGPTGPIKIDYKKITIPGCGEVRHKADIIEKSRK